MKAARTWRGRVADRPWVPDAALAAVLTAVSLPVLWVVEPHGEQVPGYAGPSATAVTLTLLMVVPIAWRRAAPFLVLAVIASATVLATAASVPYLGFALLVAIYTVAAQGSRRAAVVSICLLLVAVALALAAVGELRMLGPNLVVFAAAGLFGDWQRLQRARAVALQRRDEELHQAREERARLALDEERERIAAELRDVLAHAVTAMITQARAAARLVATDVGRAAAPLRAVDETGQGTLVELRRLVGLLRRDEEAVRRTAEEAVASGVERAVDGESPASRHLARLRSVPGWAQDALLGAVALAVELWLQLAARPADFGLEDFDGPTPASIAVVTVMAAALVLRRRLPQWVLAVNLVATAGVFLLDAPAMLLAPLVALYTVGLRCPRQVGLLWLGAAIALSVWAMAMEGTLAFLAGTVVVVAAAWLLGDRERTRRSYAAELRLRTERLEEARRREIALTVADERARVARELHDVVAHSIGVMIVQARAAARVLPSDPRRAAEAVDQVLDSGRESLTWLRELLVVLGTEASSGRAPQPGIEDLGALLDDVARAGLDVRLEAEGEPGAPLSPGVELSVYRIVQEALTNVLKHAEAEHAVVRVTHGAEITVEVVDDGRGPEGHDAAGADAGHGLLGMAERARLVGGTLEVGSRVGGGYLVRARLPRSAPAERDPQPSGAGR